MTPLHTIAVWVGNFDGRPMQRQPGRHGAAPVLRQVVQRIYPDANDRGSVPWFAQRRPCLRGGEWQKR